MQKSKHIKADRPVSESKTTMSRKRIEQIHLRKGDKVPITSNKLRTTGKSRKMRDVKTSIDNKKNKLPKPNKPLDAMDIDAMDIDAMDIDAKGKQYNKKYHIDTPTDDEYYTPPPPPPGSPPDSDGGKKHTKRKTQKRKNKSNKKTTKKSNKSKKHRK